MWTLSRQTSDGKSDIVASAITNQGTPSNDAVDAKFCIFRGPNILKIWTSQPYKEMILESSSKDYYIFSIGVLY